MQEQSKFWKVLFGAGGVTAVSVLKAFVVNKLLAIFLPPSAFACVGQLQNIMSAGQATSSLALQNGWTSLTATHKDDPSKLTALWHGGFRITVFATIFTCIAAVLFCFMAPMDKIFPGVSPRLAQAAILFALPGIVASNVISVTSAVMNGLGKRKAWAIIGISSSLLQCVWVAYFLFAGQLSVLSIIATQSIVAAIVAYQISARNGFGLKNFWRSNLDARGPWFSFALMGILPMLCTPIVLTIIRSHIGNTMGWDAAGIWQGIWKISDFWSVGFSSVLSVLILPKVTDKLTGKDFSSFFYPVLLKLAAVMLVGLLTVYLLKDFVVALFLSREYMGAAGYLDFQLIGDFFRSLGWALALVLFARQKTTAFLGVEIFSQLFLVISTVLCVKIFDFHGPMIAYAMENALYFVILLIVVRRLEWKKSS